MCVKRFYKYRRSSLFVAGKK
ncbi:hypothetical protein VCCP1035_3425A, partial [Vibrio cholerae CP1035(8)]